MVTEQQVFDELKKILVETFEVKPEEVTKDAKIYDDLDIDSIDAVDLMVKLQPFIGNRRISPADFKSVRTIGDLTETLVNSSTPRRHKTGYEGPHRCLCAAHAVLSAACVVDGNARVRAVDGGDSRGSGFAAA